MLNTNPMYFERIKHPAQRQRSKVNPQTKSISLPHDEIQHQKDHQWFELCVELTTFFDHPLYTSILLFKYVICFVFYIERMK